MNTQGVKLKEEFKTRWLAALRDGTYEQVQLALRKRIAPDVWGYCCLGVACDLTRPGEWQGGCFDGYDEFPPPDDRVEWFVKPETMVYGEFNTITLRIQEELADMNDGQGKTFVQIADWIEENL